VRAGAKTPWALAAVAALLGLFIAVFERKHETTDETRAAREVLFPGLTRSDVISVEINRGAKDRVMLTRVGTAGAEDEWRVGPADESAARSAVEELLDGIDATEVDRVATASAADAGLAPPALHLVLTAAAKHFALDVGGLDASGRGVFVRREGDPRILVVGSNLRRLIDRDAGAFRPRHLFAVEQATAVRFQSDTAPPQTLRKRARVWLNEEGTFATRAAVDQALQMLAALQVTGFPSGTPPDGGAMMAPHRSLSLGGGIRGERRLEVWAGSCPGNASARGKLARFTHTEGKPVPAPPEWICVDEDDVERLWRQLEVANRRDPHLLVVDPAGVDQIDLSEGERRLRLSADGNGDWHFAEPKESYDADVKAVSDWLAKLATTTTTTSAEATRGVRAGGSFVPRKLVVAGGGATSAELTIAPPRGGRSQVDRESGATPLFVGIEAFGLLEPEPLRFRSREVLALPQFDVRAVQIRGRRARVSLHRESGADWVREGGGGEALDTSAVDHLLSLLSNLRAEEFVIPQPKSFQAETTLDVEVRSGDAPAQHHRLALRGECRGRVDDAPVFTLATKPCGDIERTVAAIH